MEVRPLKQMTGSEEFNEVFFSDVAIADTMRLGPANGGWTVSTATLMNERGGLSGRPEVGRGTVDVVSDEARARGAWQDPVARDRLMALWCRERVLQMTALRGAVNREAGKAPGPEGSIGHPALTRYVGALNSEPSRPAMMVSTTSAGSASLPITAK